MSIHISAHITQIAPYVLITGDSVRAQYMANKFLTAPKLVSQVRNNLIFTGKYQNMPITIAASGMGPGSIGIYVHELINDYHVKVIIRLGSCGSYHAPFGVNDLVLTKLAQADLQYYAELSAPVLSPSPELNQIILSVAKQHHIPIRLVKTYTTSRFYNDDIATHLRWALTQKLDVVEMESYVLFALGIKFKVVTASLLTVADLMYQSSTNQTKIATFAERAFNYTKMFELGLQSLCEFAAQNGVKK